MGNLAYFTGVFERIHHYTSTLGGILHFLKNDDKLYMLLLMRISSEGLS